MAGEGTQIYFASAMAKDGNLPVNGMVRSAQGAQTGLLPMRDL